MRAFIISTASTVLASLALASVALAGAAQAKGPTRAERSEARLARMIEGRTAGAPVHCISAMSGRDLQVLEYVGVVYEAGDTVYVARARDPRMLQSDEAPVFERTGGQLCSSDVTRTIDLRTGFTGVVFLDNFVPYTKQG